MNQLLTRIKSAFSRFGGNSDLGFVFGLFGAVLLLVVPVHKDVLSVLLVFSIAISLLILLTVIYVKEPPEFSVFPTILLAVTLYRLGLNVASTRLILLDGDAGSVIQSFGTFVVGGNYVVGSVIFLILVIINFVVITKGAGRIAEVTARFTLDAMPGKQMSIDAEMNSGVITEAQALEKREKIQKDADFYGSMDGASNARTCLPNRRRAVADRATAASVPELFTMLGSVPRRARVGMVGVFTSECQLPRSRRCDTCCSLQVNFSNDRPNTRKRKWWNGRHERRQCLW